MNVKFLIVLLGVKMDRMFIFFIILSFVGLRKKKLILFVNMKKLEEHPDIKSKNHWNQKKKIILILLLAGRLWYVLFLLKEQNPIL